jgi:hypothetical protein
VANDLAKQYERQGKPVLIVEHDVDNSQGDRAGRWWAAKGRFGSAATPMTMVDSGFKWTEGAVSFERVFSANIDAALARPPGAALAAFYERQGDVFTVQVQLTNRLQEPIGWSNSAAIHLLLVEDSNVIHLDRFVRAATVFDIEETIEPGATAYLDLELAVDPRARANYAKSRLLVLADYRPASSGPFDMLQAALAVQGLPTPTPEPSATPTRTATATRTPTPEPTATGNPTAEPTAPPETYRLFLPLTKRRHE